ncbi:tetratricopeptide repeat protein [Stieleria varia]|nr:MerR family transcriptional regulator [Stieleria varia]
MSVPAIVPFEPLRSLDEWIDEPSTARQTGDERLGDERLEDERLEDERLGDSDEESSAAIVYTEPDSPVKGVRIALVGRFGGMNQREATNLLRSYGAIVVDIGQSLIDWVVIGAEEPPLSEADLLSQRLIEAAAAGALQVVSETQLWQQLGLVDIEQSVRRYHTPAMLAGLLDVSVQVIRRWQRLGLIRPVKTMHKLPYFDYQEVATARRLAQWIAAGASPAAIERRLAQWVEILPNIGRPLDQLSVLVSGKEVLLRQGNGLIDPTGQMRFDFDALNAQSDSGQDRSNETSSDRDDESVLLVRETVLPFAHNTSDKGQSTLPVDVLLADAYAAEDDDQWEAAIDLYHLILARDGPRADINFQIAELLYRQGYLMAARERYYTALEVDPDMVEARASLAGVLLETGHVELAIAAYRGALSLHDEYPDVHYNLAKVLDNAGRGEEALTHWRRFLELAPESPWASEAIARLDEAVE